MEKPLIQIGQNLILNVNSITYIDKMLDGALVIHTSARDQKGNLRKFEINAEDAAIFTSRLREFWIATSVPVKNEIS